MQLNEITISDKEIFQKYSKKTGVTSQFSCFVNLFLWRNSENIKYFIYDNKLIVTGENPIDKKRYFMFPDASVITEKDILYLKDIFSDNWGIYGLSYDDTEALKKNCGNLLEFVHFRDMDNYIYLSENLINLSGKKYHSKKNHINSFKKKYNYEYMMYTDAYKEEVKSFLAKWYFSKSDDSTLINEANSIVSALENHEKLGLKGGIIKVDGKIVAFSMGEQMTDQMAVIHFEKADTDYNGSYAIINNEFVKNEWSHLKYINREEDMGIEGLRKSKLSYKPEIIFEVYGAFLK